MSTIDFGIVAPKTVVISCGMSITAESSATPVSEQHAIIVLGETRPPMMPPMAQPAVIASQ